MQSPRFSIFNASARSPSAQPGADGSAEGRGFLGSVARRLSSIVSPPPQDAPESASEFLHMEVAPSPRDALLPEPQPPASSSTQSLAFGWEPLRRYSVEPTVTEHNLMAARDAWSKSKHKLPRLELEEDGDKFMPTSKELLYLVPPGKEDHKQSWRRFVPGSWKPPTGWGEKVNGTDAFVWVLWWLLRAHPRIFAASVVIIVLQLGAALGAMVTLNNIFDDDVMEEGGAHFIMLVTIYGGINMLMAELEYRLKMLTPSGGSFIPPVQQELVSYLAMAPFRKVEARAVGSMLVVATQDVEMMDRVIVAMISVISHAMIVATQFVVLCVYDFQLVLVSTISIVFLALAMDFYSPKVFSASTRLNRAVSAFQLHAQEILGLGMMVRLLCMSGAVYKMLAGVRKELEASYKERKYVGLQSQRVAQFFTHLSQVFIIGIGGLQVQEGVMGKSVVITFVITIQNMLKELYNVMEQIHVMEGSSPSLKKVTDIIQDPIPRCKNVCVPRKKLEVKVLNVHVGFALDLEDADQVDETAEEGGDGASATPGAASLLPTPASAYPRSMAHSFSIMNTPKHLMFRVLDASGLLGKSRKPLSNKHSSQGAGEEVSDAACASAPELKVLKGITVTIPAGHKVALMGRSGSGKSTFMKVLTRLYSPDQGAITFGGVPLEHVDQRYTFAGLEQRGAGFSKSIKEILVMGLVEAGLRKPSKERVQRAASIAGVIGTTGSELLLPEGLNTEGQFNEFNVGMQQRLLLARAILQNTPVLFLDEPGASQDSHTRAHIGKELAQLTYFAPPTESEPQETEEPVTLLASTHNIDLCESWDAIMYMEDGKVAEYGPMQELLKKKGAFWRYHKQIDVVWLDQHGGAGVKPTGLLQVWPLSRMPPSTHVRLADLFTPRVVAENEVLFYQGTACSNFYVVVSGNVEEYYRVRHPRAPSDGGKGGLFTRKVKMALNMIQNLQSSIEERWTRQASMAHPGRQFQDGGISAAGRSSKSNAKARSRAKEYFRMRQQAGMLVREVTRGDFLGTSALLPDSTLPAEHKEHRCEVTAIAASQCTLVSLSRSRFLKWLESNNSSHGVEDLLVGLARTVAAMRTQELLRSPYLAGAPRYALEQLGMLMSVQMVETGEVLWDTQQVPTLFTVVSGNVVLETVASAAAPSTSLQAVASPSVSRRQSEESVMQEVDLPTHTQSERELLRRTTPWGDASNPSVVRERMKFVSAGKAFGLQSLLGVPTPQEVRKATAASNAMVLSLSLPVFRSWLCSDSIVASSLNEKQCMVEAFRQGQGLSELWPLAGLDAKLLASLGGAMEPELYGPNHPMKHSANRHLEHCFLVVSGQVEVTVENKRGQMKRTTCADGDVLNCPLLLDLAPAVFSATARATTDTLVLKLPSNASACMHEHGAASVWTHLRGLGESVRMFLEAPRLEAMFSSAQVDLDVAGLMGLHGLVSMVHVPAGKEVEALRDDVDNNNNNSDSDDNLVHKDPLCVVVIRGALSGSLFDIQAKAHTSEAGPGDIVMNSAAEQLLGVGGRPAVLKSWLAKQQPEPHCGAVKVLQAGDLVAVSGACALAPLDLTFDPKQAEALKNKMEAEENERLLFVREARNMQSLVAEKERQLGLRGQFNVPKLWRRATLTIKQQLSRGVNVRALHQPLEEGMMADLSSDRLLSEIDSLHRRDDYLTRRLAQNLEKLGVLRGEWAEAGLSPAAKLVCTSNPDVSMARLTQIEKKLSARHANVAVSLQGVLAEAEQLWERQGTSSVEVAEGRRTCALGTIDALIHMERLVARLKASMNPLVAELRHSLDKMWDELGVDPNDRAPILPDHDWLLQDFFLGEKQLRLMHRAVLEGSRMGQQELDAVQREQVCTLERELAAEREVCAHVRAALRESEVSRQEMAEVFEVVGFTAKHGKTQAQELLAERHASIQREQDLSDQLAAVTTELERTKDALKKTSATQKQALEHAFSLRNQVNELEDKIIELKVLPEGSAYELWNEAKKLEGQLGVEKELRESLRPGMGSTEDLTDLSDSARWEHEERLRLHVKQLKAQKKLRRVLEEHELCVVYWSEVGDMDVSRNQVYRDVLRLDATDHVAVARCLNESALRLEQVRNIALQRREAILNRCDVALTSVNQLDLLEVIRSVDHGLDSDTMQQLEKQAEKAEAWKELVDLDQMTSSIAAEMKADLRELVKGMKGLKRKKREIRNLAKQKQVELAHRRAELEHRFGAPTGLPETNPSRGKKNSKLGPIVREVGSLPGSRISTPAQGTRDPGSLPVSRLNTPMLPSISNLSKPL